MEVVGGEKHKLFTIIYKWEDANNSAVLEPRMDTNGHEFYGPLNTRKKQNASQTSAMVLKMFFSNSEFWVKKNLNGLRLLGGFMRATRGDGFLITNMIKKRLYLL